MNCGVVVAGGKGRTSRRTPAEIEAACEPLGIDPAGLVRASKLSAKVDSAAVQDGFELYHHTFVFTAAGEGAVVQQGMNAMSKMAQRYHWHMPQRFDAHPHTAVTGTTQDNVLNLVAGESEGNRRASVAVLNDGPHNLKRELEHIRTLDMPRHHHVQAADIHPERVERILLKAFEAAPADYTALVQTAGSVGT